jgi:tetratricopeptide (TPR) repeat protein
MKKYYLIFAILFITYIDNLFANNLNNNDINFDISSLDLAWKNRETVEGEKSLLNFLNHISNVPQNFDVAWRISRFVYFVGNFEPDSFFTPKQRTKIFELGYKSGEIAMNLNPERVEGYYWYAINLGKYSLSIGLLTGLKTATKARDALLHAAKIDPTYHWAGPYRILGKYYQELPSVISFGDKLKAEEYFLKAIQIAPEFRLNTAYLASLKSNKELKLKLFREAESKENIDGIIEEQRYKKDLETDIQKLM